MLFVDASVAVAILVGEDGAGELMQRLERHDGLFTCRRWFAWRRRFR